MRDGCVISHIDLSWAGNKRSITRPNALGPNLCGVLMDVHYCKVPYYDVNNYPVLPDF